MQNLSYGYDGDDNATTVTDGVTAANSQTYGYDTLNRLNADQSGSGSTFAWKYDASGNRTTAPAIQYSYAPNSNVLTKFVSAGITTTVASNGIGSITAFTPSTGAATTPGYNAAQRLASVTLGAWQGTYNAFGTVSAP